MAEVFPSSDVGCIMTDFSLIINENGIYSYVILRKVALFYKYLFKFFVISVVTIFTGELSCYFSQFWR